MTSSLTLESMENYCSTHVDSILGVDIPENIIVTTYYVLNTKYRDSCFHTSGLIASAEIKNSSLSTELHNDGETRARYYPTPDEEPIILHDCMDFLTFFPEGDKQLNSSGTHILEWDMNPWFDLYQPSPMGGITSHCDNVNHDIVDALDALIRETETWIPYLHLLEPDCPEEKLIQAVLSQDYKARQVALSNPHKHDTVRIAEALNTPKRKTPIL